MFALGMDAYIVAGLIPAMSMSFHKNASSIGQGVTVFTLFFAISAPVFSTLLAKYRVKNILMTALILFSLSNVLTSLAQTYEVYITSRAFAGLGAGIFSPIAVSTSSHLVSNHNKGKAIAFTVGGMSIGTVLGVPMGLKISELLSWRVSIFLIAIIGLFAIISISILLPNFKIMAPPNLKERFKLFTNFHVLRVILVTFCAAIASLGLYTYLADILKMYHRSDDLTLYLTAWGLGGIVSSFSIGVMIDKFKNTNILMLIILMGLAMSFALIPMTIHLKWVSLLIFLLWGAMGWATQAPQQHILLKHHSSYGSASVALNSSINYLGSSVGAALGGLILNHSANITYLIYSALFIGLLGLLLQLMNLKIDKSK